MRIAVARPLTGRVSIAAPYRLRWFRDDLNGFVREVLGRQFGADTSM